jgi:hypothetical protein
MSSAQISRHFLLKQIRNKFHGYRSMIPRLLLDSRNGRFRFITI